MKKTKNKNKRKTKKQNFERFTANVVCLLEYGTELLVSWHVYKLSNSWLLGLLSIVSLTVGYSISAVIASGMTLDSWDIDKAKELVERLQPYWLCINTALCILMSWA